MVARFVQSLWQSKHPLAYPLVPLSWVYALGWKAYVGVYEAGIKPRSSPHRKTLCVGNITAGGTGKTPTCLYLARLLKDLGYQVVLSTSGYGSAHYENAALAPEGALEPKEWGDESALFRWRDFELPIIVGRRRVEAAEICARHFPDAVLIMDDGFQHIQHRPLVSLVLDPNPTNPWCFPAGPYREPRAFGRKRASALLPGDFNLVRHTTYFMDTNGTQTQAAGEVDLLCAVGNPGSVLASLANLGLNVKGTKLLADHDPLTAVGLLNGLGDDRPVVVTSKDFVKLSAKDLAGKSVLVADYEVSIEPQLEFSAWLKSSLDERLD